MTVVIGLLTQDFIVFASDRRRTSTEDKGVYYDDMRKHYRVNDDVIAGFSGDYNETVACAYFLRDNQTGNAEEIAEKMRGFLLDRIDANKDMQQTVLIGGRDASGNMTLITMSEREGFEMDVLTPADGYFEWNAAYAFDDPNDYIEEGLQAVIDAGEVLTIDKVISIASDAIRKVSKKDGYVSAESDIDYIAN